MRSQAILDECESVLARIQHSSDSVDVGVVEKVGLTEKHRDNSVALQSIRTGNGLVDMAGQTPRFKELAENLQSIVALHSRLQGLAAQGHAELQKSHERVGQRVDELIDHTDDKKRNEFDDLYKRVWDLIATNRGELDDIERGIHAF